MDGEDVVCCTLYRTSTVDGQMNVLRVSWESESVSVK